MEPPASQRFALGEFSLDVAAREIRRSDETVPLSRLPFAVLVYLVEHRDRVVTRAELIERFWDGKDVYDDTLHKCVGAIRRALGDAAASPRFVETRHREGYRYVGPFSDDTAANVAPEFEVETTRAVGIVLERETDADAPSRLTIAAPRRALAALTLASVLVALAAVVALRPRAPAVAALPPAPASPRSVAVLPLENLSGDPRDNFLGEGLAESLIADLSRVNGLKVISRGSAFAFKSDRSDPRDVGARLGVASVIEGSVRRSGDTLHVDVRLVSTDDGRILWSDEATGRLTGNALDVQEALACEIAAGLRVTLCGAGARVSSQYTRNAGAYREYLEGRYYWNRRGDADMRDAVRHFEAALAADPEYALAYAGLAETYAVMEANSNAAGGSVARKGEAAARRALELDADLPGAWAALGLLSNVAFAWDDGDRYLRRALELNASYAPARQWLAHSLLVRGRFEEAEAEFRLARDSDPLSYAVANGLAELYYDWRKYDRAIAEARIAAELAPDQQNPYWVMAQAYLALGLDDRALAAAERSSAEGQRLMAFRVAGDRDGERHYVDELARSAFGSRLPFSIACMYAGLGDVDASVAWLDRAYTAHQSDVMMLAVVPALEPVRTDPRYEALVVRLGLAR